MKSRTLDEEFDRAQGYLLLPTGKKKYRRAFHLARKYHLQGEPSFTNLLGFFYEHGFVVPQCKELALELYREAALKGEPIAHYNSGTMLAENFGRYEEALQWWRRGIRIGETYSLVQLGWAYENGLGILHNPHRAVDYYRKAADANNPMGQVYLARCHRLEIGLQKDLTEMQKLLEAARSQDNGMAWYETGLMYDDEEVDSKIPSDRAMACYVKAAELGLPIALEYCGEVLCMQENPDFSKGLPFLKKAIKNNSRRAKFIMAILMAEGRAIRFGVKHQPVKAFRLCQQAAENGDADAERMLGMMYERGEGVKQNREQARNWFEKAAFHGNVNAGLRLNEMDC